MTKQEILAKLNEEQQEVAKHSSGPCIVIAGPGGGKTHTLISRTQCMILDGVDPSNIVLFTFTNKAAGEIKERVISVIGESGKQITVGTYHSVCNRLLRKYSKAIGYNNNFTIFSQEDSEKLIKQIAKSYAIDADIAGKFISKSKSNTMLPQACLLGAENETQRILANVYQAYQDELFRQQAMDFDDLLLNTIRILENNADIKKAINNNWQYVIADESHDSSKCDLRLIKLLAGDRENVCMILDDNQSIYGFRGADIEAVLGIKNMYTGMKIFNLSYNYRSSQTIVEASKSLIAKNKKQMKKRIAPAREYKGSPIIVSKCKNPTDEATRVIQYVKMLHQKYEVPYSEIAILYRMSYLSRILEQAFMTAKIPYKIVGGLPFFSRMEIQDILSFIKLTVNEHDVCAFKRTVQIPRRGIGAKTIEKIDEYARNYPGGPIPIREAIRTIDLKGKNGKDTKNSLALKEYNDFLELIDRKKIELSPDELITFIVKELGYLDHLEATEKESIQPRVENLMELVNLAKEYNDVEELLIQSSLFTKDEDEEDKEKVQLMTMHASKGLEYGGVIMVGMVEGTSPHHRALSDAAQMEEERRLAYVAMTRAKDYLFMLYPEQSLVQGRMTYTRQSRFLNEIDKKHMYRN
ncbi:MAG: ATP-dependent helicase [Paraclostridium sp.]